MKFCKECYERRKRIVDGLCQACYKRRLRANSAPYDEEAEYREAFDDVFGPDGDGVGGERHRRGRVVGCRILGGRPGFIELDEHGGFV